MNFVAHIHFGKNIEDNKAFQWYYIMTHKTSYLLFILNIEGLPKFKNWADSTTENEEIVEV